MKVHSEVHYEDNKVGKSSFGNNRNVGLPIFIQ